MAVTHTVFFRVQDGKGSKSAVTVEVPTSVSLADVAIFAAEMAKIVRPLLAGQIVGVGYMIELDLASVFGAGENPVPDANSDVEEGARFGFATTNDFTKTMRVPTFLETLINASTDEVNTTDTDVAAFVAAMTGGIDLTSAGGSGIVQPSDVRAEDLATLKYAIEAFTRSRG